MGAATLVMGLASEEGALPPKREGIGKATMEDEKGLESEDFRLRGKMDEEGPGVNAVLLEPTTAYCAGGGLFFRKSTTLPGSPCASR